MKEIIQNLKEMDIGKINSNLTFKDLTTYKAGGKPWMVVYPDDVKKLIKLLKYVRSNDIKYKILGNGSNTLFSDFDYEGVIIKLDSFDHIEWKDTDVIVGAGYNLMKLSSSAARRGLTGLEFASGIPGLIGGAIFMNAGAYKSDMGYVVKQVKVLTPDYKVITMTNKELEFHYRSSFFQKNRDYVCLEATLSLKKGKRESIQKVIRERKERRVESQPLEFPSSGSVFRNPEGNFAGKLVEDLGLKGLTKGGAQVSNKHANFVINIGNAKAQDIKDLIDFVHDTVLENYDIDLKVEQEFVNWEQ